MATMQVEVVSAERSVLSGEATEVYARSLDGEIGILPGHQTALLALDIAPVKIRFSDGREERIAVHHGFLYFRENHLVVLADIAELAGDIDTARAEARLREVEGRLGGDGDAALRESVRKQQVRLSVAS